MFVPPPTITIPPPTVIRTELPPPTVNRTLGVPPPTVIRTALPTIAIPPPTVARLGVPPPTVAIPPPTVARLGVPPPTVAIPPPTVARLGVPPPTVAIPPSTVQSPPVTRTFVLPPLHVPTGFNLTAPIFVPLKPAATTPVQPTHAATTPTPQVVTPVEELAREVQQRKDNLVKPLCAESEKTYLPYLLRLTRGQSIYNILARFYPEHTCPRIHYRVEQFDSYPKVLTYPDDRILQSNAKLGNLPLMYCIREHEAQGGSVVVYFTYEHHANALWFDVTNKIINRYDPYYYGDLFHQNILDTTVREHLKSILPDYQYLGNTLESTQCVQNVRARKRQLNRVDALCQDYSLLYAIRRINGMSHVEAAQDLVDKGDSIQTELIELLQALAYRIRLDEGKQVPEKYRNWDPMTLIQQ